MFGQENNNTQIYILITLLFLMCYILLSSFLQQKKIPLHRTTIAILVGMLTGLLINITSPDTYNELIKLDEVIIFSILFPPIIFAQGYTLHKNALVKNWKYICIFGIIGTFISFLISWGLIYQANNLQLVRDVKDIKNFRTLSAWEILLLSACLCSIDTTASEQSINQYKYPKLYSIVVGQDIMKDAVTIAIFDSILSLQQNQSPDKLVVYWYTFFQMIGKFAILVLGSLLIGIVSAIITTFLNKKMRFISKDNGVTQTGFLFLLGFLTYIATQTCQLSGSISILVYGIVLNHYNCYNMNEKSRIASTATFSLLQTICEGMLFLIMGIMFWQGQWQSPDSDDQKMTHSYLFMFVVMIILCFIRVLNVYGLGYLSRFIFKDKFNLTNNQFHILFFSGMVRGAVPFVLFSSVSFTQDSRYNKNEGIVLKTTVIFIITFTSIVLNSLLPWFAKKQLKNVPIQISKNNKQKKKLGKIRLFEQNYIKPFLILNYNNRKQQIEQQKRVNNQKIKKQLIEEDEKDLLSQSDLKQNLIN